MRGWLEAHTLEIVGVLVSIIFVLEMYYVAVRNTLGPWWRHWIEPPEAGFSKAARAGWLSWNGLCVILCLFPLLS